MLSTFSVIPRFALLPVQNTIFFGGDLEDYQDLHFLVLLPVTLSDILERVNRIGKY